MKKLGFILALILSTQLYAKTLKQAFNEFYNNSSIISNKCGQNIKGFLNYLKANDVEYNSGYVVSIHEPFAMLNHFDGRWGSREKYQNGQEYFRSNWYFHVFLVLDGMAFDFSQRGMKVQKFQNYLKTAYLPKYETEKIFWQGVLSEQTERKKYESIEMKKYDVEDYRLNYGPAFYRGNFIELFE